MISSTMLVVPSNISYEFPIPHFCQSNPGSRLASRPNLAVASPSSSSFLRFLPLPGEIVSAGPAAVTRPPRALPAAAAASAAKAGVAPELCHPRAAQGSSRFFSATVVCCSGAQSDVTFTGSHSRLGSAGQPYTTSDDSKHAQNSIDQLF